MTRRIIGQALTSAAAVSFFATAVIHSTGYDSVAALARQGPDELAALVPALWLVFSVDLAVLGLVVSAVAISGAAGGRLIVAFAALAPLTAAGLQLRFLGFIPPTAILLTVGALALAAAAVRPSRRRRGADAAG